MFVFPTGIFLTVAHLILLPKFIEQLPQIAKHNNLGQALLIHAVSALGFDYFVMAYVYAIIFITTTGLIQLMVLNIKLRQLYALIQRPKYFWVIFDTFRRNLAQTLHYFAPFNRMYGRIFITFLVVNGPINGYLLVLIVTGRVSHHSAIFLALNTLLSAICLFVVHFYLVTFSRHFHRPASVLFNKSVVQRPRGGCWLQLERTRSRLRLSNLTCALYTKNQYGITYGKFGLVTLQTFSKVIKKLIDRKRRLNNQ